MSATRILAQSTPALLCAFPGWKQPTHCRLVAAGAGAALPVVNAAKTTPGIVIERDGVGDLTITFPPCRDIADVNPQIWGVTPETAGTRLTAKVDANSSESAATAGQIHLYVSGDDDAANQDLAAGDILDVSFWLDLG